MEEDGAPLALSLPTEGFCPLSTTQLHGQLGTRHGKEREGLCGGHKGHF